MRLVPRFDGQACRRSLWLPLGLVHEWPFDRDPATEPPSSPDRPHRAAWFPGLQSRHFRPRRPSR
jgi:hypothetical protein